MGRAEKSVQLTRVPHVPRRIRSEGPIVLHVQAEEGDCRKERKVPCRIADGWVAQAARQGEPKDLALRPGAPTDRGAWSHGREWREGAGVSGGYSVGGFLHHTRVSWIAAGGRLRGRKRISDGHAGGRD